MKDVLAEILYQDKRENLKDKKTIWTQNANQIIGKISLNLKEM